MELSQSLREHLISLVSANGEDRSVCTQIVDHLDDLQRLHRKLVRTAESDVGREDPKTFETLEDVKNKILKSIKSLLDTFKNRCSYYGQIIEPESSVFNHMKEIEHQTEADLQMITCHVQNATEECIRTKNSIYTIVINHDRVRFKSRTTETECHSSCENNIENMEKLLENEKQHYTDIINDLKNKICSIEDVNLATFTSYSKTMSDMVNLQMKYNCINKVIESCAETYIKASNFENICQRTGKSLDFLINDCKFMFSANMEKWGLLTSEWNVLQAQSNQILDNISNYVNQYVELNKPLDELILQKKNKLEDLNNNYRTICQLKQVAQGKLTSSEVIFDKLRCALTVTENTKDNYIIRINQQDTHKEKLLYSIRDLQDSIDKLKNKIVEFTGEDNEDYYNVNYNIHEFDLASSEKLKLISQFEKITNKIHVLEMEKYEHRRLIDSSIDKLKQEDKEKKERQKYQISSEIYEKQQLLDLTNKEMENVQVKISHCKDNSAAVKTMNNKFDSCIKILQTIFREEMIENHGKTLERLVKENGELSSTEIYLTDQIQNLHIATDSELQMEALLEERIQLLQDRMKAITAQREQIEKANRGLEEELNKLTTNFYKMENNVKVTDETDEEKPN